MRQAFLATLIVFVLVSATPAQTQRTAKSHYESAVAHYQRQDFSIALTEIEAALKLDPGYAPALLLRGLIRLVVQQNFDLALSDFDRVIELAPRTRGIEMAFNNRSIVKMIKGDRVGALSDVNKALSLNPNYGQAYNQRANLREATGDVRGALADYEKAMAINPNDSTPYNGRGNIRFDQGDLAGAISDYDKAITLNPNETPALVSRGMARFQTGLLDEALSDYTRALELSPRDPLLYLEIGLLKILKGDISGGVVSLQTGFRAAPTAFDENRGPGVPTPASNLDRFIAAYPTNGRAYEARGAARLLQTKIEAADEDFRKALELDPKLKSEIEELKRTIRK